jgi:FtsP/CotA-like multicopper oxidase with cupredoxin domain
MKRRLFTRVGPLAVAVMVFLSLPVGSAYAGAQIDGLTGTNFSFTAKSDYISGADGLSLHIWGFANGAGRAQYPGPTLIVNEGDTISIRLKNELHLGTPIPEPVSLVFPGQEGVTATAISGSPTDGALTLEVPPDGTTEVEYTFVAANPGTYHYHSGTRPDLQIELGLVGAIIVRPAGFDPGNPQAYGDPDSAYDHEYLFLLTEMDLQTHLFAEFGLMPLIDTTTFFPVYWFINGRNAPDTMLMAGVPWLPTQPYNCMPRMHPGEKLLMRIIGAGRDSHPFHPHGNNARIIAVDGRLLQSPLGVGADLAVSDFTLKSVPGQTLDAIFEWTGAGLGWDIYGHAPGDDLAENEYAPDHGKPFPVILPEQLEITYGAAYSGSPFLGALGDIPPGEGGLNANGGYFYMWHSHNEKEMVNNDIFPGGMMTMLIIEPPGVPIP